MILIFDETILWLYRIKSMLWLVWNDYYVMELYKWNFQTFEWNVYDFACIYGWQWFVKLFVRIIVFLAFWDVKMISHLWNAKVCPIWDYMTGFHLNCIIQTSTGSRHIHESVGLRPSCWTGCGFNGDEVLLPTTTIAGPYNLA